MICDPQLSDKTIVGLLFDPEWCGTTNQQGKNMVHVGTMEEARKNRIAYTINGALLSHMGVSTGSPSREVSFPDGYLIE